MDDLTYLYSGNRLRSVEDAVPPATYLAPEDFQNQASMPDEYLYDPDGNLLKDHLGNLLVSFTDSDQDGKPEITRSSTTKPTGCASAGLRTWAGRRSGMPTAARKG